MMRVALYSTFIMNLEVCNEDCFHFKLPAKTQEVHSPGLQPRTYDM